LFSLTFLKRRGPTAELLGEAWTDPSFGEYLIMSAEQGEAAQVLGVSVRTVQRRLNRSLLLLANELEDLKPGG
jgi:hypothetical protein